MLPKVANAFFLGKFTFQKGLGQNKFDTAESVSITFNCDVNAKVTTSHTKDFFLRIVQKQSHTIHEVLSLKVSKHHEAILVNKFRHILIGKSRR